MELDAPALAARSLSGWRLGLARVGLPALLGLAVGLAWASMRAGLAPGQATAISILCCTLLGLLLERVAPETPSWLPSWQTFGLDLTHSMVASQILAPAVRAAAFGTLVTAGAWLAPEGEPHLWPDGWPLALQVALAVLVADLGAWLAHRWMHLSRVGWRIHAVHHSATRLHLMAAGRSHPFNSLLTLVCETGPLVLLGVGPEAFALWTVFKAVNGQLQHSNIAFRPGFLSGIITTTEVHRWHHSLSMEESNTNFGNSTMIWDRLFGTFYRPRGRTDLPVLGNGARIPESYWAHLGAPFLLDRWERAAEQAEP